ncbi:MAG: Gfo/Idh/MocA family oxidoreductase [Eudoraea sp.]|nr:Gfo/Idh/MocA family oxidoreductase [Eudoraea sp.]
MDKIRVLVVGCGHMGASHSRAYLAHSGFEIAGLVSRSPESRGRLSEELGGLPTYSDYKEALKITKPDAVSINTYPDTHAAYAELALQHDCHVFIEKPLATTVEEAEMLVSLAQSKNKKIVIGYILRVHPSWTKFVSLARSLGKPLVMRMNLNQQSSGDNWFTHKQIMQSMSPIVDCGVHYVDMMCLMTEASPVRVHAIGARLTEEVDADMYNYGHLHVVFDDGSVGWYEAAWGPMISETAFFVKDVIGPAGCVSISDKIAEETDDVEGHSKTGGLLLHHASLDSNGQFAKQDEYINTEDEPDHDGLCALEQEFFYSAITGDLDISQHMNDAIRSLQIVLAADRSIRAGKSIEI